MALGRVWYGAKYSHRVWERFAHTFEKSFFSLKSRSVNYVFCHPALAFWGALTAERIYIYIYRWQSASLGKSRNFKKMDDVQFLKKCPYFRLFWKPISDYFGKTGCFFKIVWKRRHPRGPLRCGGACVGCWSSITQAARCRRMRIHAGWLGAALRGVYPTLCVGELASFVR